MLAGLEDVCRPSGREVESGIDYGKVKSWLAWGFGLIRLGCGRFDDSEWADEKKKCFRSATVDGGFAVALIGW